ncbi:MAG: GspH/FimT family pseudopilin [Pseudomonadota bacterium]
MKRWSRPAALCRQRGISLVEIAVVLAILALLLTRAVPTYSTWLRNTQIRTAAESMQNGLQLARAEAIRRNRSVQFALVDAPATGWTVGCVNPVDSGTAGVEDPGDCLATIQARAAADGSERSTAAAVPAGARVVTFDSIGRVRANADASPTLARIDLTDPDLDPTQARPLRVTIDAGGGVRMCDPALPPSDPRAC